jgi:hypothetical protein
MHRTIDAGPGLLVVGALILVIGLFAPWYDGASAWTSFEALDLVLAALAVGAGAVAFGVLGNDVRTGAGIAAAALIVVLVQVLDPPPVVGNDPHIGTGAWISLAGTVVMVAGAALTLASFSISVNVRGRERRRRVAAVDRRDDGPIEPEPAMTSTVGGRSLLDDDVPAEPQRTENMPALAQEEEPPSSPSNTT